MSSPQASETAQQLSSDVVRAASHLRPVDPKVPPSLPLAVASLAVERASESLPESFAALIDVPEHVQDVHPVHQPDPNLAVALAEGAERLPRWQGDPNLSLLWALTAHPGVAIDGLVTPRARTLRIARMSDGDPGTLDSLAVLFGLRWDQITTTFASPYNAPGWRSVVDVGRSLVHALAFGGRAVEWVILLPGRVVQQATRDVLARVAGSRVTSVSLRHLDCTELDPVTSLRAAAYVQLATAFVVWSLGILAFILLRGPSEWLGLLSAMSQAPITSETELLIRSAVTERAGPWGLGLWIPLSLLASSVPTSGEVLRIRESLRNGSLVDAVARVVSWPLRALTLVTYPLAKLFSSIGFEALVR